MTADDRKLFLFTNDHEHFVAADMDDLKAVYVEYAGNPWDDDVTWWQVDDGKKVSIWCNVRGFPDEPHIKGNAVVTKTAAEWAAEMPRGQLCSEDY